MPYKISGFVERASKIVIIREDDWTLEKVEVVDEGNYEVLGLAGGFKMVGARHLCDGEFKGYGLVEPLPYGDVWEGIDAWGQPDTWQE